MFHIALLEPEVPPNTGNIIRLCAATGASLHLIGRLGFPVGDRTVRRAAVDYFDEVQPLRYASVEDFERVIPPERTWCFSAHSSLPYTRARYQSGDALLFGCESRGLPDEFLERSGDRALCIPMPAGKARSLNLANAVAIVLYEALRQINAW
jgi:tRNA (cytidine/uridine-2'-O-)-methyltransferase